MYIYICNVIYVLQCPIAPDLPSASAGRGGHGHQCLLATQRLEITRAGRKIDQKHRRKLQEVQLVAV